MQYSCSAVSTVYPQSKKCNLHCLISVIEHTVYSCSAVSISPVQEVHTLHCLISVIEHTVQLQCSEYISSQIRAHPALPNLCN